MTVPAPPVNPIISIRPLHTAETPRDSTGIPAPLSQAKHGDVLEGFVVNRDKNQNPILRTPQGDVLIKSEVFLKTGSNVRIQVDAQLESRARIVSVNGQSLELYAQNLTSTRPKGDSILPSSIARVGNFPSQAAAAQAPNATQPGSIQLPAILLSSGKAPFLPLAAPAPLTAPETGLLPTAATLTAKGQAANTPPPLQGQFFQANILSTQFPSQPNQPLLQLSDFFAALPSNNSIPTPNNVATAPPNNALLSTAPHAPQTQSAPATASNVSAPLSTPTASQSVSSTPTSIVDNGKPSLPPISGTISPPSLTLTTTSPNTQSVNIAPFPDTQGTENTATVAISQSTQTPNTRALLRPGGLPLAYQSLSSNAPPTSPTTTAAAPQTPIDRAATPTTSLTPTNNIQSTPFLTGRSENLSAPIYNGTIIGAEPSGESILSINHQTVKLLTSKPLPVGTQLQLSFTPTQALPEAATTIPQGLQKFSNLASHWPNLEEAASLLASAQAGSAATNFSPQALAPNIGPTLTAELMFFLSAVQGGDLFKFWPKELAERLEKIKPDLLKRLQGDGVQLQQLAQPQPSPGWSTFLVPLFFHNEAQHMRLYIRGDDAQNSEGGKRNIQNQRFIMEVELSHLGAMQLDGFIRGKDNVMEHFDLTIRSQKPLSDAIENKIDAIFSHALVGSKLQGHVNFQIGLQHFIHPASELKQAGNPLDDDFTIIV